MNHRQCEDLSAYRASAVGRATGVVGTFPRRLHLVTGTILADTAHHTLWYGPCLDVYCQQEQLSDESLERSELGVTGLLPGRHRNVSTVHCVYFRVDLLKDVGVHHPATNDEVAELGPD